jgi:ATPase subunit of ABC transporter with duplicated ATPase domains
LLDEPTNHLDLEGVLWLGNYLENWSKAFIIISHNIGFVREVANNYWLIERTMLNKYSGSYYRFQEQHKLEIKKMTEEWEKLEKVLLAIKKKGTPESKTEYEEKLKSAEVKGIVRPPKYYAPKFFFMDTHTKHTGSLMSTSDTMLGYGDKVILKDVNFALYEGSRVALVGGNGSGKSTFLKFLSGELEPLEGHVDKRRDLRVVKFEQHFYHTLPEDKTPLQYVQGINDATKIDKIRTILGASGLEGAAHNIPIGTLSGGQKARVYFASIVVQNPDIILMDEPTNHLDVETIQGLADGLKTFKGAAIIVSHDLNFLEEVATEVWQTSKERLIQLSTDISGLDKYVTAVVASIEV